MTMTTREPISIENGRVEIHTPENRVWLTRHQIADLFGVFVPAVGSNIRSILKSGILREERVYRRERNRDGGIVELYSLEMIAASFIPIPVPRYISSGNLPGVSVSRIPCIVPCPESNNRE